MAAVGVFWVAVLLLAYTYAGYPLLMRGLAVLRPRPPRARPIEPTVTIVVAAHDEAACIGTRLRNLLALDYPRRRLDILVGSDGSTDRTVELANEIAGGSLSVVAFARRRGKPAVLNDLIARARGEIVVLADARQRFEAGALRALVAPFADPEVGAVGGELVLTREEGDAGVAGGVGAYWRYEKRLRADESLFDSSVGASGAICAIRRDLFEPLPRDLLLDDVLIPMRIVRRGYRVVFEPRARAIDRVAATAREEFRRKTRTLAGVFQLFARQRWIADPRRNRLWWQTLSHKGLRLAGPLLLAAILGANLALVHRPLYLALAALQAAFYGAATAAALLRGRVRTPRVLGWPHVFCLLNAAVLLAAWRSLSGRQAVTWERAGGEAIPDRR